MSTVYIDIHWHFVAAFVFPPLGATPSESCRDFKNYLFQALTRQTPLSDSINGVLLKFTSGVPEYSIDCVHKLVGNEIDKALQVLTELFDQTNPLPNTIAEWSANAAAQGHHVGFVYVARGGHHGRGELSISVQRHMHGIFSFP